MADMRQLPPRHLPAAEGLESHHHVIHHPGQLLWCVSWQGRVSPHHELWTMPLRAARFRRAALAALAAGCALALSACSLMQGATLTPVAPQINAAAGDAPVFFEESVSGGEGSLGVCSRRRAAIGNRLRSPHAAYGGAGGPSR